MAMTALAWLQRPGKRSCSGWLSPAANSARAPAVPVANQISGWGREKPHFWQLQSSVPSLKRTVPPQSGHPVASLRQRRPAPTHMTLAALPAAHATRGSSELATTTAPVASRHAWRQRWATWRTSLLRSSWSRLRLSNTSTDGRTCAATRPNHASSTSSTAGAPAGPAANAAARPAGMLAPSRLVTTGRRPPSGAARPAARSLVVVVLPLVPETSTTWRPPANTPSSGGVDGEDGVPADDRTRPAPSGPGKSAGAAAHHHRQARPEV